VEKVFCSGIKIEFIVVRKPIKNLYLRVKDGFVQINCNKNFTLDYIKEFICKNREFVLSKLNCKKRSNYLFGDEVEYADEKLYRSKLPTIIMPIVNSYSKKMQVYPSRIGFRFNKTRWGSCSHKDSINFNYYLAKLPIDLIEYVVVHELAHIKHKNHSKEFWSYVEKFMPDMKKRREKLREFEKII